jgi:hypothetical protein
MIRFLFSAIIGLTISLPLLFAQVTLQYATHSLAEGIDNSMILCNYAESGEGGENMVWDFSGLANKKGFTGTLNSAASTNNSTLFPAANIELGEFNHRFYFKATPQSIEHVGYASTSGNYKEFLHKSFVKMKYPFGFGDYYSGDFYGDYQYGTREGRIENGFYSVEGDAYGTLILPGNITLKNVLRVKTVKNFNRVGENYTQQVSMTTYRYYDQARYPRLTLIKTEVSTNNGRPVMTTQAAFNNDVNAPAGAIINASTSNHLQMYPNPVIQSFTLEFMVYKSGNIRIDVLDNTGKLITNLSNKAMDKGLYIESFSIDKLEKGNYLIRYSNHDVVETFQFSKM